MAPTKLAMEGLQRTISDISMELSKELKESINININLPPILEVKTTKCECCGMREEWAPEYIAQIRDKFGGKLICGLCPEVVKEEMEKKGQEEETREGEEGGR